QRGSLRRAKRYSDGIAVGVITTESESRIVNQCARERARPAQRERLCVDAIFRREVPAADYTVAGPRGILTAQMPIAVAAKETIGLVEVVIHPSVERIDVVRDRRLKIIIRLSGPTAWRPLHGY